MVGIIIVILGHVMVVGTDTIHSPINHPYDNRLITGDTCIPGQLVRGKIWMDRCASLGMILQSRSFVLRLSNAMLI